jgi:quercetin dioxygenase-like cupin family protein
MNVKLSVFIVTVGLVMAAAYTRGVQATPAQGFTGQTIVKGTFGDIDVFNHIVPPDFWQTLHGSDVWLSSQKTKGDSDLYIQNNTWQPGATTGWHSHPGHSLIIITSGTVTDYESDDPQCTPHVYKAPATFVDSGGSHVHMIRNETSEMATGYAVQLIPAGATRRIDADMPANCPF